MGNASATLPSVLDWYIIYDVAGRLSATPSFGDAADDFPFPSRVGTNPNKNQVLHQEKGLVGDAADGSKMIFQGVIRIPRGKQRIGRGTKLVLVAGKEADDKFFCVRTIYKSYR